MYLAEVSSQRYALYESVPRIRFWIEITIMFDRNILANSSNQMSEEESLISWSARERSGAQAIAMQLKVAGLVGGEGNLLIGNPGSGEEWLYLEFDQDVQMGLAEAAVGSILDGASRLRSKPAVAIAHGFIGFSGLQGDVFNAAQRQSPMLVIVGTADSQAHTGETHLYADVEVVAQAARAKYVKNATDPETLLRDLRDAIVEAQVPPFGPVVFIVGSNVAAAPNRELIIEPKLPNYRVAPPFAELEELAREMLDAKKPAILIGDGIARSGAQKEIEQVAELLGADVWGSMESEVNFPRHHALYRGNLGRIRDEVGRELLKETDYALAVGTPVYQTVFNSKEPLFDPSVTLAAINYDTETNIRGHNDISFPIVGDPKQVLSLLIEALKTLQTNEHLERVRARQKELHHLKQEQMKEMRDAQKALHEQRVNASNFGLHLEEAIAELGIERPIIFNEALVGASGLTNYLKNVDLPGMYFDTVGGALGEWAGAVGAALVRGKDKRTIVFIGDGGFHYAPQALWNAAQKKLKLGLVVVNNQGYGLLYLNMESALRHQGIDPRSIPKPHYYELSGIDYLKIAEGYGVKGVKVEHVEQIRPAIEKMLQTDGPFLIDLVVEEG